MAVCQNKTNYAGLYSLDNINGFELMIYQNMYAITLYNPRFAIKPEKLPRSDTVSYTHLDVYKRQIGNNAVYSPAVRTVGSLPW